MNKVRIRKNDVLSSDPWSVFYLDSFGRAYYRTAPSHSEAMYLANNIYVMISSEKFLSTGV